MSFDCTANRGSRIFLDAMNIHTGGGAALLDGLLAANANFEKVVLLADSRYVPTVPFPKGIVVSKVKPSVWERMLAARWVARTARADDHLICLGNLPPLIRVRCPVTVYIQNRYVIDSAHSLDFPLRVAVRLRIERFWLRWRSGSVDRFVVQTSSMRRLLEDAKLAVGRPIDILPFIYGTEFSGEGLSRVGRSGFLYVASGEPHKNHLVLLDAWRLLAEEGFFPQLRLTLDVKRFPDLVSKIVELGRVHSLDIVNLGWLPRKALEEEYYKAGALLYASSFESFGMPLVEARQAGLPIIAPELDYVRDVAMPVETFDPSSALSLSRAVKRFVGRVEVPDLPLSSDAFLRELWPRNFSVGCS